MTIPKETKAQASRRLNWMKFLLKGTENQTARMHLSNGTRMMLAEAYACIRDDIKDEEEAFGIVTKKKD